MSINVTHQYVPPEFNSTGFNCPHCFAYAQQNWGKIQKMVFGHNEGADENLMLARCEKCERYSIWKDQKMVYPRIVTAPLPNADLTEDIKKDFEEARCILEDSPRGAAALLRLVVQKICRDLGEPGRDINADIGTLVRRGLPLKVQQALDTVRVVGNNAVHPGQIDLSDDRETAMKLFGLVNLIADVMITQPRQVEELYNSIVPENLRLAIERRDSSAS
jgi:hypothetical protein